jgi:hypothetical protein
MNETVLGIIVFYGPLILVVITAILLHIRNSK